MISKEKARQNATDIRLYRILCLLTIILVPIFGFIYKNTDSSYYVTQNFIVAGYFVLILFLSFINENIKKSFNYFIYLGFFIETVWGISLTFLNSFHISYAI